MSHFITLPINENGVVTDLYFQEEIKTACDPVFGTTDVLLYSHGWWTTAVGALSIYNRFTTGFSDRTFRIASLNPPKLTRLPKQAFGIGLHWPSMFDDDPHSLLNEFECLSYYTMEKRADVIGEHALYSILRTAIETRETPLKFHLLGHSFGCRVVASALQQIAQEFEAEDVQSALDLNVVLLQAAFKNNQLEPDGDYGLISSPILDARVLITTSTLDRALKTQFPFAQKANFFAKDKDPIALGFGGPTQKTIDLFHGMDRLSVPVNYSHGDFMAMDYKNRLLCADLSDLHKRDADSKVYTDDPFGGFHSDIYMPELYELIAAFLFA